MKKLLAVAVQVWKAEIVLENPADDRDILVKAGTFTDMAGVDSSDDSKKGVFIVTFTPTLAGTSFKIRLSLNGLDVDATAAYRSKPLVVLPATTTSAVHSNYTILTQPGQAVRSSVPNKVEKVDNGGVITYVDVDPLASTSYTYVTGDYFRVLIDARDEFSNLRYASTTDKFEVRLTGETLGTLVEGTLDNGRIVAHGNGSYTADLLFQYSGTSPTKLPVNSERYELSIKLGAAAGPSTPIKASPLTNKILVKAGLAQAAHTELATSVAALTAGVSYTYDIRARDIYQNIVLNTQDEVKGINFQLRGPAGASPDLVNATMDYRFQLHGATFTLLRKGAYTGIITAT